MGTWRRLGGRLALVLVVFASGYLGARLGMVSAPVAQASHNFPDVPDGYFAHDFVDFLVNNAITSGCQLAPPLFCPEQPVTRGQMSVFLKKLADLSCLRREGTEVIFEGCNVHIRSGAGATDAPVNGLGNLIVGYNEPSLSPDPPDNRTGSHNLVVGRFHTYAGYGGFVAGVDNAVGGNGASVSGGSGNTAGGPAASVSGGAGNTASGRSASVSGGSQRSALGSSDWVAGALFQDD
jgi:hypothetical protein